MEEKSPLKTRLKSMTIQKYDDIWTEEQINNGTAIPTETIYLTKECIDNAIDKCST